MGQDVHMQQDVERAIVVLECGRVKLEETAVVADAIKLR